MYQSGFRNLVSGPISYPRHLDRHWSSKQYAEEAKAVLARWGDFHINQNGPPYSDFYGDGFIAGYVDHMLLGGTGEPPYLPPRQLWWGGQMQIPAEVRWQASGDWFEGFREGAAVAKMMRAEGLRTVPSSATIAEPIGKPQAMKDWIEAEPIPWQSVSTTPNGA